MADVTLVEGMEVVVAYCGFWPSFHDAVIRKVEFDSEANDLTIIFILNEMDNGDAASHLAHLTVKWYGVEKLSLSVDYTYSDQNWLWEVKFNRADEWLDTELLPNDSIGGTIRARRIEVTHFEPIDEG